VESGKFDIGTGVDATAAREKIIDVVPVYQGGYTVRTRADGPQIGPTLLDLCGLKLGLPAGGSLTRLLSSFSVQCVRNGRMPIVQLAMPSDALVLLALQSGRIDGMIAFNWYSPPPGTKLVGPTFGITQSGIAVRKGSALGPKLVTALKAIIADGTYTKILARYSVSQTALSRICMNPARD
jgi:polar amino acid transport system substrate-binding protein